MTTIRYMLIATLFVATLYAEKVEVVSDSMKADDVKKEVRFIGNAKVTQGKNWITADTIIVYLDANNQAKQYVAVGKKTPSHFYLDQPSGLYKGKADKITYNPVTSVYLLEGHAIVDDLRNIRHLAGEKITIDAKNGNADVKGHKSSHGKGKKPVKFIFDTKPSRKKPKHKGGH